MKYETRSVFIVKGSRDGVIHKVFGIQHDAETYAAKIGKSVVVDEWPTEFQVEKKNEKAGGTAR